MSTKKNPKTEKGIAAPDSPPIAPREGPLVFISHDTRDADLAEALANLLTDASGGMLKSFRSSDRKGTAGIEFGQEWYKAIMASLAKATDVVALLTHHSLHRPWILYESGVAKGKLDTTVLGVAVGIPLEQAQAGPFAQFQNCGDDEDSLTKLVMQLIRRNPNAAPRDEAVRLQVRAFRDSMTNLLKTRGKLAEPGPKIDDAVIAKMFEEVKILVRDLPDRLQNSAPSARRRRFRRFHPGAIEDIVHHPMFREQGGQGIPLLIYLSMLREDFPWLYELGLELYRAMQRGDEKEIERAQSAFRGAAEAVSHGPMFFEVLGGPEDEESFMFLRLLSHHLDRFMRRSLPRKMPSKRVSEDEDTKGG
jgi:hypothetical protein